MFYIDEIKTYIPKTEQEIKDKNVILDYISLFANNILTRENEFAHITSSSLVFNEKKDKVLMVFHNIYKSWSWTGGHADGNEDLFDVALKEAAEETGIKSIEPLNDKKLASLDILPVWGHMKKNSYVASHLHLSWAYLLKADESEIPRVKPDENSGVKWILINELEKYVTEPNILPVYEKLIKRAL